MTDWIDTSVSIDDLEVGSIGSLEINTEAIDSHTHRVAQAIAEREDYALRGAWMYGYPYVHVFESTGLTDPLGRQEPHDRFTVKLPVYMPAYEKGHPQEYADRTYSHTYDFESIPDRVLKAAMNGELDMEDIDR